MPIHFVAGNRSPGINGMDEVVLTLKGKHHYLWRTVDQDGHTLDILVQSRCQQSGGINRQFPSVLIGDSSSDMLHT